MVVAGRSWRRAGRTTLDATGGGQIDLYVPDADVIITSTVVRTDTVRTQEATVTIFRNSLLPAGVVGGTYAGSFDASGSQYRLQAGDTLTAVFVGADASTGGSFEISGTAYPAGQGPPITNESIVFDKQIAGAAGGEKVTQLSPTPSTFSLAGGATSSTSILDVRPYASFYLSLVATVTVATRFNTLLVLLEWFADPLAATPLYRDAYEIFPSQTTVALSTNGGRLVLQDMHHGPYLRITVTNTQAAGDTIAIGSYQLFGTTRPMPSPFARDIGPAVLAAGIDVDEFVIDPTTGQVTGLGAGGNADFCGLMRPGLAHLRISTTQQFTYNLFAGSLTNVIEGDGIFPAGTETFEVVLPKRSVRLRLTNNGGVAMNAFAVITTSTNKVS